MATQHYSLSFQGFFRNGLPPYSGIYCVYAGSHNQTQDTVSLRELLYIGESANIQGRVSTHEKISEWVRRLQLGEQLWFNYALIMNDADRRRAEAAMIYEHKPPCNSEYKHSFPFDSTSVETGGRNYALRPYFVVYRSLSIV